MKSMSTIFTGILVLLLITGCATSLPELDPEHDIIDTSSAQSDTFWTIDSLGITIIKVPEISTFLFLKEPGKSLADIAADSGYSIVVNGSYFDYERPLPLNRSKITFLHAGYLRVHDSLYAELMPEERQLTTLFSYDFDTDRSEFLPLDRLEESGAFDLVIQTGPQIIRNSLVQEDEIKASINGMGTHARSAFASVDNHTHYFITVKQDSAHPGLTLVELGEALLASQYFSGNLSVVNLDGGSSTSLYVKDNPELSHYGGRKILPALICVE